MRRFGNHPGVRNVERDYLIARAVDRHAPQLAARPDDHALAIRHPVHHRIDAIDRPCLLQVEIERAVNHALFAGREILYPKLRLVLVPPHEGKAATIGRRRRTNRAAIAADSRRHFTRIDIVTLDIEDALRRILRIFEDRTGGDVAGVVDRVAIGRIDRFAQLFLHGFAGPLHQLHPAAAGYVIEPDFSGPGAALGGEMLLGDDVTSVGGPAGLVQQAEVFLGHLQLVRAVGVHQPDIVATGAVGNESDAAAIGRESGLDLPGKTFSDAGRRTARYGHRVNVAKHRECERPPVGRHVDIHPRPFIGVDGDFAQGGTARCGDIPTLVLLSLARDRHRGWCSLDSLATAFWGQVVFRRFDFLLLYRIGARFGLFTLRVGSAREQDKREGGSDAGFHDLGLSP